MREARRVPAARYKTYNHCTKKKIPQSLGLLSPYHAGADRFESPDPRLYTGPQQQRPRATVLPWFLKTNTADGRHLQIILPAAGQIGLPCQRTDFRAVLETGTGPGAVSVNDDEELYAGNFNSAGKNTNNKEEDINPLDWPPSPRVPSLTTRPLTPTTRSPTPGLTNRRPARRSKSSYTGPIESEVLPKCPAPRTRRFRILLNLLGLREKEQVVVSD